MSENRRIPFELSDYVIGKSFTQAGKRQGWLNEQSIIAAVSGGGDSTALLLLCSKFYSGRVIALHVNHGIRGEESDADETFTANFARSLGCEFVSRQINVPSSRMKGESLESAARRLRHKAICEIAHTLSVKTILLGHNRDDLAETVLFNLLRGTGIRGAVGMTETTQLDGVRFCRPLLSFRREFLRDILRVRGLAWREDSTNNDDAYTRNYIRLKLIPSIEQNINSSAVEHLAQFGEDMRTVREREDAESAELFDSCLVSEAPVMTLNARTLRAMDADNTALVIREAGRLMGLRTLSRRRCDELSELIRKGEGFIFQWEGTTIAECRKGRLTIHERTAD